ncbi:SDR family oxidoreductase [Azoarcus sp. KH32C]|uniref:SDR family oxidoreductase n=1 Tax=Azoarcus sp. KH32C TaxID=748247 RepID=UPI0002385F97|nr:SDR family oxidoreductase [Azoarcus sp. KH32C]BAL22920.1 short chain dehydrogenase [Azoarcus sp. KH32C]
MKKILIIGATSAIAGACARLWAAQGASLFLVARDAAKLDALAADLGVRGAAAIHSWQMDATDLSSHAPMLDAALETLGEIDIALIAHGTLPDQAACEADAACALREFATNGTSVIALLTLLASQFERQRDGTIGVITSVAGDRGRPSNYVYGSAKAAVSVFCEGLRARLFKVGVALTDIRPGFVATPMTDGLPLPGPLVAQPDMVARRIVSGIERRADVVYAPAFWALIMAVIRNIPRPVFKRLKL